MPKWLKEIRLKDLLTDDETPDDVRLVADAVAQRLKRQPEYDDFGDFTDIAAGFEGLSVDPSATVHHFNVLLGELYDWADRERVWVA